MAPANQNERAIPTSPPAARRLSAWLDDIVTLHQLSKRRLSEPIVHDLRVAIRRCRSVAQGLKDIDDDDGKTYWRALNAALRPLFVGLGGLRDLQVMREHTVRLLGSDACAPQVLRAIDVRIRAHRAIAKASVLAFSPEQFSTLARAAPNRAADVVANEALLHHLALRRMHDVRLGHAIAMRHKTPTALHELRVHYKRLRYTVESFLPGVRKEGGALLKHAQQLLGDLHDLDVLRAWLASQALLFGVHAVRVDAVVKTARDALLSQYVEVCAPPRRLLVEVRGALPVGRALLDAHRAYFLSRLRDAAAALRRGAAADALMRAMCSRVDALRDPRAARLLAWASACVVPGAGRATAKHVARLPDAVDFGPRERAMCAPIARAALGRLPRGRDIAHLPPLDAALVHALAAVLQLAEVLSGRIVVRVSDAALAVRACETVSTQAVRARGAGVQALLKLPIDVSTFRRAL